MFLILDNLRVHHSKPVKAWVAERQDRIELYYLPSYSPELNPEERSNADLKQAIGTKVPARTKAKLKAVATQHMTEIERFPERVKAFFKDPSVLCGVNIYSGRVNSAILVCPLFVIAKCRSHPVGLLAGNAGIARECSAWSRLELLGLWGDRFAADRGPVPGRGRVVARITPLATRVIGATDGLSGGDPVGQEVFCYNGIYEHSTPGDEGNQTGCAFHGALLLCCQRHTLNRLKMIV